MKKTWIHGSKCGTMRVITATLRNGRVVVASGGPDRARKRERSLLWFSCWFPRRPAWTRIMLSAWHRTRYQMPAHEDRYTPLLLRPETSIVYLRKRGESERRKWQWFLFRISRLSKIENNKIINIKKLIHAAIKTYIHLILIKYFLLKINKNCDI